MAHNYTTKPSAWYLMRLKRMDEMVGQGASLEEIAERFDLCVQVVRTILREAWKRGFLDEAVP